MYAYLKSKHRASLLDDTVKAILLTQVFADVLGDPAVPFTLSSSFVLSSDAYGRMLHGSIGKQYSCTCIHDTINFTTVIAS